MKNARQHVPRARRHGAVPVRQRGAGDDAPHPAGGVGADLGDGGGGECGGYGGEGGDVGGVGGFGREVEGEVGEEGGFLGG